MQIEGTTSPLASLGIVDLLNSLPDGAYITDEQRTILFWNRSAERITGWKASEVVGRTCFDNILCHSDQDGHPLCGREHCPLHRSIVTGERSEHPLLVFAGTRSGDRVAVEVTVSPLRDGAGRTIGGIEIFRDMSGPMEDLLRAPHTPKELIGEPPSGDPRVVFHHHTEARDLVGGDFARIDRVDDNQYAILLLDVRGHGLAAALYTMYLRSQWDELRAEWTAPAEVMRAMNKRAYELAPDAGYLATAVAVNYHAGTGKLRLVRAGHPEPVIMRAGGEPSRVGLAQPALGLDGGTRYKEDAAVLHPGDSLLLYSDGAVEILDMNGNEIGLEGLLACLPPVGRRGMELSSVPEQLLQRSCCIRQADDLTLIALTRTGR